MTERNSTVVPRQLRTFENSSSRQGRWSPCSAAPASSYQHQSCPPPFPLLPSLPLSDTSGVWSCSRLNITQQSSKDWAGGTLGLIEPCGGLLHSGSDPIMHPNATDQSEPQLFQEPFEMTDAMEEVFETLWPHANWLMVDAHGHYVIQKLIQCGSDSQKRLLVECVTHLVDTLSVDVYGCRVVQTAINHAILTELTPPRPRDGRPGEENSSATCPATSTATT